MTARAEAGQRLDDVHPRTRVPLELEVFDAERHAVEAAIVAYPHGAAAPVVADAARARRRASWTSPPTSGCATAASTRTGTASTRRRSCFGQGVYGLPELTRDAVARRRPRRQPRLLPDGRAARAGAAGARGADRRRRRSTPSPACPAPAGRPRTRRTSSPPTRTCTPYKIEGHRHTPEIEQELAALGSDVTITFMPHLLPLAQGELVSCYVTPRATLDATTSWPSSTTTRTRASRSSSCAQRPGRRARRARHQLLPDLVRARTARTGRVRRVRGDRQPLEGRRVAGRAEPQPDVRTAGGGRPA